MTSSGATPTCAVTRASCSAFSSARRSIWLSSTDAEHQPEGDDQHQREQAELAEQRQAGAADAHPGVDRRLTGRTEARRTLKSMPEGDTIHYAARRIRPVLEGHVPDELATPHPRFARDRWPERLAGPRGALGRRPRQAPVPALRGRADDPLAPADERARGACSRPAGAAPPLARRLARAAARRRRGRAVQRPRARADDGVAHALRPAHRRPRAGHPRPRVRLRALPAAAARGRPDAADRRRRARAAHRRRDREPVEGRGVLRGRHRPLAARPARSATRRRWRSSTPPARACSSPRATATRPATGASTAAPGCRARAAAAPR